ncbi:transmembrane sensor [Parabacteroides sp. PF5-5]|uniref:FecR family protein n=1 Tax=unclassified Parabacteroides TaxID=2649774 RepID=UPI002473C0F1|nr:MULTISPECIES: FecR domain-containing protein [unclassified Parabacteroides]MDH6305681.1 transmembrane sensor [Parabacteroides sp. PH5-39]MDH6316753.1 transmembrane sensor [Parabacteroides sp. PF5-13]MDH6320394.1 transmembrane sensor [Parabacteroides sp. PH5-13]MDH6324124.1 transmembrane sensor [Parabacteroides sp. PH5-8]MDH6327939.1 transmembrane sensor [Parabacteroides sp. PH5-41]
MEEHSNIEAIILHYLQHTISEDEMRVLMAWVKESEENKKLFFQLKNTYDLQRGLYPSPEEIKDSKERLLAKLHKIEESERQKQIKQAKGRRLMSLYKYTAVAVLCIGLTLGMQHLFNSGKATQYVELDLEAGPRMSHMTLSDGTKVVLNASSKLKFPEKFNKNVREVFLDGEAYFDVVKNEKIPFVVRTDKQVITVLGTQFNVMNYSADDYAITTLVSGSIQLQSIGESNEEVVLKPNQQAFFNKNTNQLALSSVKIDLDRTWVNKLYHFRKEPLHLIAARLEKIYGVNIQIKNDSIRNIECTGTFGLDQKIEEVLRLINFEKLFTYKIKGDDIIIE